MRTAIFAALLLIFLACSRGAPDAPFLATLQRPFAPGDGYPLALVEGELIVHAGCIGVRSKPMPDGARHLTTLVFPHGYRLQHSAGTWQVLDTAGRPRARLHEAFSSGGGEISGIGQPRPGSVARRVGSVAAERCPGPWFLVNPTREEMLRP